MATGMETKEKKPRLTSAGRSQLPTLDVIVAHDVETAKHARSLLAELVTIKSRMSADKDREAEIKLELHSICVAFDIQGLKDGLAGFEARGYQVTKTLDREKLVSRLADWGVPAGIIEECTTKESEPWLADRLVVFDVE